MRLHVSMIIVHTNVADPGPLNNEPLEVNISCPTKAWRCFSFSHKAQSDSSRLGRKDSDLLRRMLLCDRHAASTLRCRQYTFETHLTSDLHIIRRKCSCPSFQLAIPPIVRRVRFLHNSNLVAFSECEIASILSFEVVECSDELCLKTG